MRKIYLFLFFSVNYFCVIFSYDSKIPLPLSSHVWGTFLQTNDGKVTKQVTISWEPENTTNIYDRPVKGKNLSLIETFELADRKNKKICMWGTFEVDQSFFEKAENQYNRAGLYKCIDTYSRPYAVNCIHRLSDIGDKKLITHFRYGRCAGNAIYHHFYKNKFIRKSDFNAIEMLNLQKYKIKKIN